MLFVILFVIRVFDNQTNTDETTDETKDGQGEIHGSHGNHVIEVNV